MSDAEPSEAERDGLEAVRGVVDVTDCERLVPSGNGGTPDWRVWMADGRVADVEVTTCTDRNERRLSAAMHAKDGTPQEWPDRRLAHRWTVFISDPGPRFSKRPSAKVLIAALCNTLESVEAGGGTPAQMAAEATRRLAAPASFLRQHGGWRSLMRAFHEQECHESSAEFIADWCSKRSGYWLPELLQNHILTGYGGYELVHVEVIDEPELLAEGKGTVKTIPALLDGGVGHDSLVPAIQRAINQKKAKMQFRTSPGLKWLAVMLDGIPGFQLGDTFGPRSQAPHPTLDIRFDYCDEVWAVARETENFVVVRFSDGGARQHHPVVSRSETVASG